jgi:hypothetical protein
MKDAGTSASQNDGRGDGENGKRATDYSQRPEIEGIW